MTFACSDAQASPPPAAPAEHILEEEFRKKSLVEDSIHLEAVLYSYICVLTIRLTVKQCDHEL